MIRAALQIFRLETGEGIMNYYMPWEKQDYPWGWLFRQWMIFGCDWDK